MNRRLNDHTTQLLRLKAQYALATNDQVSGFRKCSLRLLNSIVTHNVYHNLQLVVIGTEGGKAANTLLQANAVFDDPSILHNDQKSQDSTLAHLAVASGVGDVRIIVGSSDSNKIHF